MTAAERLWIAVLERAVDDLKLPANSIGNSKQWFNSDRTDEGSFLWICEQLGVENRRRIEIGSVTDGMAKTP